MTQYKEPEARWLESRANEASGKGWHGIATQLWALAADIGTRVEYDDDGFEIEDGSA